NAFATRPSQAEVCRWQAGTLRSAEGVRFHATDHSCTSSSGMGHKPHNASLRHCNVNHWRPCSRNATRTDQALDEPRLSRASTCPQICDDTVTRWSLQSRPPQFDINLKNELPGGVVQQHTNHGVLV